MSSLTESKDVRPHSPSARYVPWEPYRGAVSRSAPVTPLVSNAIVEQPVRIPYKVSETVVRTSRSKKTSLASSADAREADAQEVADGGGLARAAADGCCAAAAAAAAPADVDALRAANERLQLEVRSLDEQLQTHCKVNAELKRLLVAAMGDDLQEHLRALSQDKVRLADDIRQYSQQLDQGGENVDRLTIQNDVWRSKFLASSVMVDELVGWRVFLNRQIEEAQSVCKSVMHEHDMLRKHLFQSLVMLTEVKEALEPLDSASYRKLFAYHTLYDLVTAVHSLSDSLHHRLLKGRQRQAAGACQPTVGYTAAESGALQVAARDTRRYYETRPCDELRHVCGRRQPPPLDARNVTIRCCKKCAGKEIKLL